MRKYTLGWKHQFSLTWNMLPGEDENTFDSFAGRNTLVDALNSNLGTAILSVKVHEDVGSQFSDAYTVFVESYSETLVRRWATDQFWQCSLELVEQ